jgi:serine/threonine protein phosphatase PrpC
MSFNLLVSGKTDRGCVRARNEDSLGWRLAPGNREGIFIVCDGMGGQPFGDVASKMAVESVLQRFDSGAQAAGAELLNSAIVEANAAILEAAAGGGKEGMGTTIVAAVVEGESTTIAHVGDSRAYLLRDGKLQQLTTDHSFVNEQLRRGIITPEEAQSSSLQNIILRALGSQEDVQADIAEIAPRPDEVLLLCSDGLTRMVPDAAIAAVISNNRGLEQACAELIEKARVAGGHDNITCLLVKFQAA